MVEGTTTGPRRLMLTGATGFIGRALSRSASLAGHEVVEARRSPGGPGSAARQVVLGDFSETTDWSPALHGVEVVVHCAGLAHVAGEDRDAEVAFRRVNVEATRCLAGQAAAAGVRRFVFISSIGVNGSQNVQPFTEQDAPAPTEPYAISKLEAEQGLFELGKRTGMEIVVIRPPLVYGPDAPGNFGKLVNWVNRGVPLPLACIQNKRSLVALDNLVDFITVCVQHPAAANEVFLVADGHDLSTPELLQRVGHALGRPARLFPVPPKLLHFCAGVVGRKTMAEKLCGSLQVDIGKARRLLGWQPPFGVDEALLRSLRVGDSS